MAEMEFSVLMSVYFKEEPSFLKEALLSIRNQTRRPGEIILMIDGGISSALEQVIDHFKRINPGLLKTFGIPSSAGLGNALKLGLNHCQHEIVARMDSDDIAVPSRFAKQFEFLKNNHDIAIVGSNIEEFNNLPGDLKRYKIMPENETEIVRYAKYRNPLNHPTIMFRKDAVISSGSYNGDFELFEDYSLFIRMLVQGHKFHNIQENLLYFRIGDGLANIRRRSGMHYVMKELKFLKYAYIKFINLAEYFNSLIMKIFLRLVPPKIVLWFYKKFLRFKSSA